MNHCENEPNQPFSIWKCHWSKNNKIKICRKKCQKYYQLSTADNKLKCFPDDGWENKTIAECIDNNIQEPFLKNFSFMRFCNYAFINLNFHENTFRKTSFWHFRLNKQFQGCQHTFWQQSPLTWTTEYLPKKHSCKLSYIFLQVWVFL